MRCLRQQYLLAQEFDRVRHEVLSRQRDDAKLRQDVSEMREKMRRHLDKNDGETFSLKQSTGGIVDIEFMVQFVVLAKSHDYPDLTRWNDNIRILEMLEKNGVLPSSQTERLIEVYKTYRSAVHSRQLQGRPAEVTVTEFKEERREIIRLWQSLLGDAAKIEEQRQP